jgi:hypothetical protein
MCMDLGNACPCHACGATSLATQSFTRSWTRAAAEYALRASLHTYEMHSRYRSASASECEGRVAEPVRCRSSFQSAWVISSAFTRVKFDSHCNIK